MPHRLSQITWAATLLTIVASSGCNRSPYQLAPVHGHVTIDDKPLTNAKIMFAPVEVGDSALPGKPAFGLVKDDGSFNLTTYDTDDGAVVGEHWVTVVNLAGFKKNKDTPAAQPKHAFTKLTLPKRVQVAAGQPNEIDLKLSTQDIAQFGVLITD